MGVPPPWVPVTVKLRVASCTTPPATARSPTTAWSTWTADEYFDLRKREIPDFREEHGDSGQDHVNVYFVDSTAKGAGFANYPSKDGGHVIVLTDQEDQQPDKATQGGAGGRRTSTRSTSRSAKASARAMCSSASAPT